MNMTAERIKGTVTRTGKFGAFVEAGPEFYKGEMMGGVRKVPKLPGH